MEGVTYVHVPHNLSEGGSRLPALRVVYRATSLAQYRAHRSATLQAMATLEELSDGYGWTVVGMKAEPYKHVRQAGAGPREIVSYDLHALVELALVEDDDQEFDAANSTIMAAIAALEGA